MEDSKALHDKIKGLEVENERLQTYSFGYAFDKKEYDRLKGEVEGFRRENEDLRSRYHDEISALQPAKSVMLTQDIELKVREIIDNLVRPFNGTDEELIKERHDYIDLVVKAILVHIALPKKGLTREEIMEIICHFGQLTTKYPDKKHLIAGDTTFISASQYKDLADAILSHGKGEK